MDALSAGYQRRLDASQWWQRPFVRDEAQRLAAYENLIFEYFDKHTIISRQDQQRILHPKRNEIVIVSNGVDTNYFNPREAIKKYDLVFTGNMSYPPNVECARRIALEILPIIKEKFPTIKLLIAGATPLSTVQELASDNVYVSGWMEDIREAYAGSQIFVAPMRTGSGLQNKLLEAMSMKMACVTTALAAHPLEAKHDQQLMIGETNAQIAAHILLMLNDEKKANALAKSAREFVVERFNWKSSVEVLEQLFEGA